jgi:heme exporter protein A
MDTGGNKDLVFALEDVSYGYGASDVLRSVQLHIPARRTILVTGPNGSGKTTLFKLLAGVLSPRQGKIRRWVSWGEIGCLGHETYLYPGLTVLENLVFWCRVYQRESAENSLLEILRRVGLRTVAYEPASHLSRGMAQRLSLARVLALAPKVLLLDEPTAGLDAQSQDMMGKEIIRARQQKATVLWITQSPQTDMSKADYVLQVGGGKVCMQSCAQNGEMLCGPR